MPKRTPVTERFWTKVDKSGDCWIWTASTDTHGYGRIGVNRRLRQAHRLAWEWVNGPIPDGMQLDHTCYTRACVRPDHLRLVTNKQNAENCSKKLPSNNTSGVRGVSKDKTSGLWQATVKHNGRYHWLGRFKDIRDAEAAVVAKRLELFTHNDLDRAS